MLSLIELTGLKSIQMVGIRVYAEKRQVHKNSKTKKIGLKIYFFVKSSWEMLLGSYMQSFIEVARLEIILKLGNQKSSEEAK